MARAVRMSPGSEQAVEGRRLGDTDGAERTRENNLTMGHNIPKMFDCG